MRRRSAGALGALALLLTACATGGPVADIPPGTRPALDSDEAGLWMALDQMEAQLRTSGHVVEDPALEAYVHGIVCRLDSARCGDLRIYLVEAPQLNAAMAPNGFMMVWTGLLLRARDESQLASALGHELAHYRRRHTLQQWRDARAKAGAAAMFSVLTAAAGVGFVGVLGEVAAYGSVMAFSREQEREADELGIRMMAEAGYDPGTAAELWDFMVAEKAAMRKPETLVFLSTHPAPEERAARARELARAYPPPAGADPEGRRAHQAATASFVDAWLRDELRQREYAATELMLRRLAERGDVPGTVRFYEGEIYRLRGGSGDPERAIAAYRAAVAYADVPVVAWRSLGQALAHAGHRAEAREAFATYLTRAPEAPDRLMVEAQLEQL